jgi:2-polyprenyl-3-methyl-5-hydroxy-6-metoxy-1,4-benzoquinol methylase
MAWRRVNVIAHRLATAAPRGGDGAPTAIMDYGCGTGVLLEECSRHAERVYGVDLVLESARLLQREWELQRVTLMTPAEAAAQVAPGSLDVIVAAEVLEHVEPLEPALDQFRSWLKPEGRLLVSLPTENLLYKLGRRLAGFSGHYHHANAATIAPKIERAGFALRRREHIPVGGPMSIYWVLDYARA